MFSERHLIKYLVSIFLKYISPESSNILEIEFKFEYGTGYRLASQTFLEENENYLQLDTIFMLTIGNKYSVAQSSSKASTIF